MAPFGYAFRPYKSGQSRSRGWGETRMAFLRAESLSAFRALRAESCARPRSRAAI